MKWRLVAYCCCAVVILPKAKCDELSAQAWANASVVYSDNLQLIAGDNRNAAGGIVNAGADLRRAEERGYLSIVPSLRFARYDSTVPLDSTDQEVKAAWDKRDERSELHVDTEWTRDTSLTSELEISGLVQARKRRLQRYLAPSLSYEISQRSSLVLDAAYTMVSYNNARFTGLVDYKYASTDLSWTYLYSDITTVTGTFYGAHFKVDQLNSHTNTAGMRVSLKSDINERWSGNFSGGVRRSTGYGLASTTGNGWLVDLDVSRKDEVGRWRLAMNRTVDPSGTGVLVQRDQLELTRNQHLNYLWRWSASAYWVLNKDLQSITADQNRHYRYATLRLSRVLSRRWSVDAQYSYAWQRFSGQAIHAERNMMMLNVHYSGQKETE